jgi:hypothetical protein
MNFVTLTLSQYGTYSYQESSSIEMDIVGFFLCNVGCDQSMVKDWALADKNDPHSGFSHTYGTNVIFLEEEDDCIYLSDDYSQEQIPTRLKMTRQQFVQLLDDWTEKICKHEQKPKEVTIKNDNDQFIIEINE